MSRWFLNNHHKNKIKAVTFYFYFLYSAETTLTKFSSVVLRDTGKKYSISL